MSTPITWDEIDEVDPRQFTIATVPARFALRARATSQHGESAKSSLGRG